MLRLSGFAIAVLLLPAGVGTAHAAPWKQIGPPGANVYSIGVSPRDPRIALAVTDGGVRRSTDGGVTWGLATNVPPKRDREDVDRGLLDKMGADGPHAIAFDPTTPGRVFLATSNLPYRSLDDGETWAPVTGLPGDTFATTHDVDAVAFDPIIAGTVWAATSAGPIVTTDGGDTWTVADKSLPQEYPAIVSRQMTDIVVVPRSPRVIVAAFDGPLTSGVWRLIDDASAGWQRTSPAGVAVRKLALEPSSGVLLAATAAGVQRSTDDGATWNPSSTGLPVPEQIQTVLFDPATPGVAYAGGPGNGLFRSADGGVTWGPLAALPSDAVSALALIPAQPSPVVLAGTYDARYAGLFRSADGGSTWQTAGGFTDVPATTIAVTQDGTIYAGAMGGLFFTELGFAGIVRGRLDESDWRRLDLGPSTPFVGAIVIDPTDPRTLYAGTSDRGVVRSVDGGDTWSALNAGLGLAFVTALVAEAGSPTTLYAAGFDGPARRYPDQFAPGGVWRSTTAGASWVKTQLPNDVGCVFLAGSPTAPGVLYTLGYQTDRTQDGGATWTPVEGYQAAIAIDPRNPSTVWACDGDSTFSRSRDAGATWERGPQFDLPLCGAILADPQREDALYVGMAFGVMASIDGGTTWSSLNTPAEGDTVENPQRVASLALTADRGTLIAGTVGNGIFTRESDCRTDAECDDRNTCTHDACVIGCVHPLACLEAARCALKRQIDRRDVGCPKLYRRLVLPGVHHAVAHVRRAERQRTKGDPAGAERARARAAAELDRVRARLSRGHDRGRLTEDCYYDLTYVLDGYTERISSAAAPTCLNN